MIETKRIVCETKEHAIYEAVMYASKLHLEHGLYTCVNFWNHCREIEVNVQGQTSIPELDCIFSWEAQDD